MRANVGVMKGKSRKPVYGRTKDGWLTENGKRLFTLKKKKKETKLEKRLEKERKIYYPYKPKK